MGLFKESIKNIKFNYLTDLGFKQSHGPKGEYGFVKIINHDDIERLWITVDPNNLKVYLYNEYDFGGMLYEKSLDIPEDIIHDKDAFINWLDEEI